MFNFRSLPLQTFIAMVFGVGWGLAFGPQLSFLGGFSQFLVSIIKAVALPLVFFAILDGFLKSEFRGKGFFGMLAISALNAFFAVTIALVISNTFHPGKWLNLSGLGQTQAVRNESWFLELSKRLSGSDLKSLLTGTTLVIVLSLVLGLSLVLIQKFISKEQSMWLTLLSEKVRKALKILFWVVDQLVLLLPLALS